MYSIAFDKALPAKIGNIVLSSIKVLDILTGKTNPKHKIETWIKKQFRRAQHSNSNLYTNYETVQNRSNFLRREQQAQTPLQNPLTVGSTDNRSYMEHLPAASGPWITIGGSRSKHRIRSSREMTHQTRDVDVMPQTEPFEQSSTLPACERA